MIHKLALITVVYNDYASLENYLHNLKKQTNINFHVFIVDNSEERKEIPLTHNSYPITLLPRSNLGYAYGLNEGLKAAIKHGFLSFAVMNNDIELDARVIDETCLALTNNPQALIGAKIYYAPGYEYHTHYEKKDMGNVLWYDGGTIDWHNVHIKHTHIDLVDKNRGDKVSKETQFITGCFMAFNKAVIDSVGYFDETYFMYMEDADFCVRATQKNVKLIYNPAIMLHHKESQSSGGGSSNLRSKYITRNRIIFGLKYAPFKTKLHLIKNHFSQIVRLITKSYI
jgi:GT2 family glycosyltransferase